MTPERKIQLLAQVAEFDRLLAERGVLVVARDLPVRTGNEQQKG